MSPPDDDQAPVYPIRLASRLTGIAPDTLRAWERRYGLPSPARRSQGYRAYSEADLRVLRWLRRQLEAGHSIGQLAARLAEQRARGIDPTLDSTGAPLAPEVLVLRLVSALTRFDVAAAEGVYGLAIALYPLERVLLEVIKPALIQIGEAWHRGDISVATEHFATQFCKARLLGLLTAAPQPPAGAPLAVAACAPGEQHEVGLLILAVLLRLRGRNVVYFGPDLPPGELAGAVRTLRPALLMFSATGRDAARRLAGELPPLIASLDARPTVVVGGQGFRGSIRPRPDWTIVDDTGDALACLEAALGGGAAARRTGVGPAAR